MVGWNNISTRHKGTDIRNQVIDSICDEALSRSHVLEAGYEVGLKVASDGMILIVVLASIEANGGLISPLHLSTLICVDSIGLGTISYQNTLECIGLEVKGGS